MKNSLLSLLILTIISSSTFAQKINYEKTFEIAQQKSKSQNKILFVKISLSKSLESDKYDADITFPDVVKLFNEKFINYENNIDDSITRGLARKYSVQRYPALLFFDSKGGLISKESGSHSAASTYITIANNALAQNKEKSLVDFDMEYKNGKVDGDFLKQYITKRIQAGIKNNSYLIDRYVDFLKVSDLSDYKQVLFIMKAGPLAYGKAHRLVTVNNKIIDSIYKTEPFVIRQSINNTIIENTLSFAIARKNKEWATAASNFTRTTYGNDYREAQKQSTAQLLKYYRAIKDTINFLQQAVYHYDQHYMNVSKDSIEKRKAKNLEKIRKDAFEAAKAKGQNFTTYSETSTVIDNVPIELNNAAFDFYLTGTKNPMYINKAITWSKRSIEFEQVYGFYDTLAHLLYRLDYFAEAEFNQNKAIELAKAKQIDTKFLQAELLKMKNRTL